MRHLISPNGYDLTDRPTHNQAKTNCAIQGPFRDFRRGHSFIFFEFLSMKSFEGGGVAIRDIYKVRRSR